MAKETGSLAKNLLGQAKDKGFDMKELNAVMDSEEGRALLRQLSGGGGDALKYAAAQAAEGDTGAVSRLLGALMSSKEGQALTKQIMSIAKKK